MRISSKYVPEEGAAGRDDHLVSIDLFVFANQRHIHKVFLRAKLPDARANVALKIIPAKTEFLR